MNPLVSIIIPVFNKAAYIRQTLDSALGQTYPHIELILVNDGSTDGSLAILEEYKDRFPDKIVLLDQANGGVSKATNVGIQASRGDYIQFLDADDLLTPNKIENQFKLLQNQAKDVVASCEWVNFRHDISNCTQVPYGVFGNFESGLDWLLHSWNNQEMMADSSWLTPKELVERAGLWNETLSINQDGEFFMRVLLRCSKVIYDTESKAYYRVLEEGSVSKQKSHDAAESLLSSFVIYQKEALVMEDSRMIRAALKRVYMKFIYDIYPLYPDLIKNANDLISKLGISEKTFIGGPKFQQLSKVMGFENALRLKRLLQ
ncbi:glycosyltransferase family 2 protein [Aquiflexum gelatinilyticum]|uniref:glycosyltransferase family 2 protein n=1 Tax=Aquiflexum gelatinilyticum TaxID=2961943 RepID=UPI00216943FF|nr:glycosyltransferase family 2 protein [Aquiflexum gelatinilyticum]MCS4434565.1 glycosyltransferase family 2 protein [Aquiflexum gelatinilyticum]